MSLNKKTYYISLNGEKEGPFTQDDILGLLVTGQKQWTDFIFCEDRNDWVRLMEHSEFTNAFNRGFGRSQVTPIPMRSNLDFRGGRRLREKEWYVLRDGNNYGPYSRLEIVQMLQQKSLYEFSYVWNPSMSSWTRLAEVREFACEQIREMKDSVDQDVSEIFFRRRHSRVKYGCTLLVHDSKSVFKGQSIEISEGGAGIVIENQSMQPGQTIYLHFQPGDGVPPFNVVCTIVSKQWLSEKSGLNQTLKYGVKFDSMSQPVREYIRNFADRHGRTA